MSWYLSDMKTTSRIPLWMMSLAHSLHGNKATYICHTAHARHQQRDSHGDVALRHALPCTHGGSRSFCS